jgi:predicted Rossmann-fold nucleotide-binding protein
MGIIADAVLRAGGEAQGVIPEHLMAREVGHRGLTKLHMVRSMHERKALGRPVRCVRRPAGRIRHTGVVTWTQLGLHAKPCGILNILGYYSPLLAMFDHAVEERFLKPENRALVMPRESPADLLQALEEWRPVHVEKWLSRETR